MDNSQSSSKPITQNDQQAVDVHDLHTFTPQWSSGSSLKLSTKTLTLSSSGNQNLLIHGLNSVLNSQLSPLPANCTAEIISIKKSDGLEIWITYRQGLGWIFRSDTKCRIFRDMNDAKPMFVPKNESPDHTHAAATIWFEIIRNLNKHLLEELCEELEHTTLIGEFTGSSDKRNIIRYTNAEIFFYAMVPNAKPGVIAPPSTFFSFCEKYGLDYADFDTIGDIHSDAKLRTELEKVRQGVQTAKMVEAESGAYVFVVLTKGKLQKVHHVSLVLNSEFVTYQHVKGFTLHPTEPIADKTHRLTELKSKIVKVIEAQNGVVLPNDVNFYLNVALLARNTKEAVKGLNSLAEAEFATYLLGVLNGLVAQTEINEATFATKNLNTTLTKNRSMLFYPKSKDLVLKNLEKPPQTQTSPSPAIIVQAAQTQQVINSEPSPPVKQTVASSHTLRFTPPIHPLSQSHTPTRLGVIVLPVVLPGMGTTQYFDHLSACIQRLNSAGVFGSSVSTGRIEYTTIHTQTSEELAESQHRLSVEGHQTLLYQQTHTKMLTQLVDYLTVKPDGQSQETERVVVLVDRAFTLEAAGAFIAAARSSITKGSELEPKFICLAKSSLSGSEEYFQGLNLGPTGIATILARRLRESPNGGVGVVESLLAAARASRGTIPTQHTVKQFGFDGFIGFPFLNIEWEDEVLSRGEYQPFANDVRQLLLDSESEDPAKGQRLQNLLILAPQLVAGLKDWWEIEDPEQQDTKLFDVFVAKSVSTIYKKFDSFKKASQVKPSDTEPVHEANLSPAQVQQPIEQPKLETVNQTNSKLIGEIVSKVIPSAMEALTIVKSYENMAERDSLALKSAFLDKPSSWKIVKQPRLVCPGSPEGEELSIVAFAYIPACTILALPKQPLKQSSYLCFAESSNSQLTQDDMTTLVAKLNCEGTLALDRNGPVEELTALRIDGRLVYIVAGSCTLQLK